MSLVESALLEKDDRSTHDGSDLRASWIDDLGLCDTAHTAKVPGLVFCSGQTPVDSDGKLVPGGVQEHTVSVEGHLPNAIVTVPIPSQLAPRPRSGVTLTFADMLSETSSNNRKSSFHNGNARLKC